MMTFGTVPTCVLGSALLMSAICCVFSFLQLRWPSGMERLSLEL